MRLVPLLFVALTGLAGCGKGSPTNQGAADKERAQGAWMLVKIDVLPATDAPPEAELKNFSGSLTGNLLALSILGDREKEYFTVAMDGSKSPGWVDFTASDEKGTIKPKAAPGAKGPAGAGPGDLPPDRLVGIYKFEGDQLVVAVSALNGRRPTEFKADAGKPGVPENESGKVVVVYLKKK